MIEIRPIQPHEWTQAKRIVYSVAHVLFNDPRSLEDSIAYYEARHELQDMDDIQKDYFDSGGTFLAMFEGDKMICTGAIRRLDEETCELKRLWLLQEYHGQGLGYRILQELLSIAREMGYKRMRLETNPEVQRRALSFYKRIGFYEIPRYTDQPDDIAMELIL